MSFFRLSSLNMKTCLSCNSQWRKWWEVSDVHLLSQYCQSRFSFSCSSSSSYSPCSSSSSSHCSSYSSSPLSPSVIPPVLLLSLSFSSVMKNPMSVAFHTFFQPVLFITGYVLSAPDSFPPPSPLTSCPSSPPCHLDRSRWGSGEPWRRGLRNLLTITAIFLRLCSEGLETSPEEVTSRRALRLLVTADPDTFLHRPLQAAHDLPGYSKRLLDTIWALEFLERFWNVL